MRINKNIKFEINGENISHECINNWEHKRMVASYKQLSKIKDSNFCSEFEKWIEYKEIDLMRDEILNVKMNLGIDTIREKLKMKSKVGNFFSKLSKVSGKKRKHSITEIIIPKTGLSPQELLDRIIEIMMINNDSHLAINLNTNPDHYVLQSISENIQEVLEITGGSPLPTHFFAHYGDTEGLTSNFDKNFDVQVPGAARLKDNTLIGGVRHQVRKEGEGLRFRALVEFPAILPNFMIEEHQFHLACEFGHWITAVLNKENFI